MALPHRTSSRRPREGEEERDWVLTSVAGRTLSTPLEAGRREWGPAASSPGRAAEHLPWVTADPHGSGGQRLVPKAEEATRSSEQRLRPSHRPSAEDGWDEPPLRATASAGTRKGPRTVAHRGLDLRRRRVGTPVKTSPLRRPRAPNESSAIARNPTLRQAWSGECPRPQFAFEMSMFNVSCNSH